MLTALFSVGMGWDKTSPQVRTVAFWVPQNHVTVSVPDVLSYVFPENLEKGGNQKNAVQPTFLSVDQYRMAFAESLGHEVVIDADGGRRPLVAYVIKQQRAKFYTHPVVEFSQASWQQPYETVVYQGNGTFLVSRGRNWDALFLFLFLAIVAIFATVIVVISGPAREGPRPTPAPQPA